MLLDRTNGKNLLTAPFVDDLNWAKGLDAQGRPIPDPDKEPKADGTLVSPASGGAANWSAPSFNPLTRDCFTLHATESYSVYYLTDLSKTNPKATADATTPCWTQQRAAGDRLQDRQIAWSHVLSRLGRHAVRAVEHRGQAARSAATPRATCSPSIRPTARSCGMPDCSAPVTNGPITFELDGRQYVVVGADDLLYAFTLPR